ncbi:MAG: hypothetical protein AAF845_18015 [Bacteroidota bacterium]
MNAPARPLADVTEQALRALAREIGVADTARFLQQFGAGRGDYTKDRDALFGHLTLDDVIEKSRQYDRDPEA